MWFEIGAILVGFAVLVKSADLFVDGAVVIAKKLHIDEIVIGITLVAIGTSLPEFFVNFSASQRELDDALFGNVLGSSLFNLLVILGLQVSIQPFAGVSWRLIGFDLPMALLLVILSWIFAITPVSEGVSGVTTWEGLILSGLYVIFILKQYRDFRSRKKPDSTASMNQGEEKEEAIPVEPKIKKWAEKYYYIFIIVGIVGLYFGSEITVENSVLVAKRFQLSEAFIGVFILSVGTSLPELMTTLVALRKNYGHLALGNVLGSNICNIGLILAFFAWFNPIGYNSHFNFTFIILTGMTSYCLLSLLIKKKKSLSRIEGILMVLTYLFYAGYSYYQNL